MLLASVGSNSDRYKLQRSAFQMLQFVTLPVSFHFVTLPFPTMFGFILSVPTRSAHQTTHTSPPRHPPTTSNLRRGGFPLPPHLPSGLRPIHGFRPERCRGGIVGVRIPRGSRGRNGRRPLRRERDATGTVRLITIIKLMIIKIKI